MRIDRDLGQEARDIAVRPFSQEEIDQLRKDWSLRRVETVIILLDDLKFPVYHSPSVDEEIKCVMAIDSGVSGNIFMGDPQLVTRSEYRNALARLQVYMSRKNLRSLGTVAQKVKAFKVDIK